MKSEAFANFTLTYLPTIGMIIFLAVFITVCAIVFIKNKESFDEMSKIPMNDGANND